MSQPVKLSDELVLDARTRGEGLQRSIAGQIEHWARIGRAIEPILQARQAQALAQSAPVKVSDCLKIVGTEEGHERLRKHLESGPFPHYEGVPNSAGLLIRTESDGKKTMGRFVNRQFQSVSPTDAKMASRKQNGSRRTSGGSALK